MEKTSSHARRYDDEFKKQAVVHVLRAGVSQCPAAKDLGASEPTLAC